MKEKNRNSTNSKPPARGGPSRDKEESDDDTSTAGTATTEGTLVDANDKEYQVNIIHKYFSLSFSTLHKIIPHIIFLYSFVNITFV